MSHFAVLVIGDDVDEQLAPYHEYECTGQNDQYVQDVDVTDELQDMIKDGKSLEDALGWYGFEERIVEDESQVNTQDAHKWGYAIVRDDQLVKAVNRTNPNRKWDWYVEGGRWGGYFPTKDGSVADSAELQDVDFDKAKADEAEQANELFDEWEKVITQHGTPLSWSDVRSDYGDDNIEGARNFYNAQGAIEAFRKETHFFMDCPVEVLGTNRAAYVKKCEDRALVPYALVKDGKWYQRGEMGWFGMSSDEKDPTQWNREFHALMTDLPPDTVLTMVDCHI